MSREGAELPLAQPLHTHDACTKMATLRAAFLISYRIDDDNQDERSKAIVELLRDISLIDNQPNYFVRPPASPSSSSSLPSLPSLPPPPSLIHQIFRDNSVLSLAQSRPITALNTPEEVKVYIAKFILDGLYKAVKGAYPEGNGELIHGQHDDDSITPLTNAQLEFVRTSLGKRPKDNLISFDEIEALINTRQKNLSLLSRACLILQPIRRRLQPIFRRLQPISPLNTVFAAIVGAAAGSTINILSGLNDHNTELQEESQVSQQIQTQVYRGFLGAAEGAGSEIAFYCLYLGLRKMCLSDDQEAVLTIDTRPHLELKFHSAQQTQQTQRTPSSDQQPRSFEARLTIGRSITSL